MIGAVVVAAVVVRTIQTMLGCIDASSADMAPYSLLVFLMLLVLLPLLFPLKSLFPLPLLELLPLLSSILIVLCPTLQK